MIVCLCTGATDRDIHTLIDEGAKCLCDFKRRGIGTSCGACHESIRITMQARGVAIRELCFEEAILARLRGQNQMPPPEANTPCRIGA